MMIRIFKDNLVDLETVTRLGVAAVGLPIDNVADSQLSKIARITGGSIEFDFGEGVEHEVQALIVANHNIQAPVVVDYWSKAGIESRWTTISQVAAKGETLFSQCTPILANKVRLTFEQEGSVDIGRIFLGRYDYIRRGLSPDGYSIETIDDSETQSSVGGQEYTAIQTQYRTFSLGWTALTASELTVLQNLYASHGKHTPFFLWMKEFIPQPVYVRVDSGFAPEMLAGVTPRRWDLEIELKEQL